MKPLIAIVLVVSLFAACTNEENTKEDTSEKPHNNAVDTTAAKDTLVVEEEPEPVDLSRLSECLFEDRDERREKMFVCLKEKSELLSKAEPQEVDSIYLLFLRAFDEVAYNYEPQIDHDNDFNVETGKLKEDVARVYANKGFSVDSEEGMYFLKVNRKALSEVFAPHASKGLKAYLDFKNNHSDKIAYDAGLVISPTEFAKRMIALENIIISYPELSTRSELISQFTMELPWFLGGLDNTPAFDFQSRKLRDENKQALEHAIEKGSPVLGSLVKKFYEDMKANNWEVPSDGLWEYFGDNFSAEIVIKKFK